MCPSHRSARCRSYCARRDTHVGPVFPDARRTSPQRARGSRDRRPAAGAPSRPRLLRTIRLDSGIAAGIPIAGRPRNPPALRLPIRPLEKPRGNPARPIGARRGRAAQCFGRSVIVASETTPRVGGGLHPRPNHAENRRRKACRKLSSDSWCLGVRSRTDRRIGSDDSF